MTKVKYKRRIKIIKPRLQLKLVGIFVGISALGFLLQSLIVGLRLAETAMSLPDDGGMLMGLLPRLPIEILVFSFGMVLPLTFAVGVVATHRIAGPVYRFEQYLESVKRGEQLDPCRLRKTDELQELCQLINEVTEPLRQRAADRAPDAEREPDAVIPQRLAG
ncbi:MAG: hypothetical protein WD226_02255 [Planctomycetota bacterium]